MAVISITITEATKQVVSGIPSSVTLSTNIPSTIFYTLDGTTPTVDSSVYVGPILIPTDDASVTLGLFATNGVDSSAVITKVYGPTMSATRQPHDTVIGLTPSIGSSNNFPFGDNAPLNPVRYGKSGGITVDSPDIPNIPDGYDGTATGTFANGTDRPLTNYEFVYSTSNSKGETGHGIGTVPGKATIRVPTPTSPSSSSEASSKFFNPRAMVIYQDSRKAPFDDVPQLNRGYFSLANPERSKNGATLMNTAFESSAVTGSFLRSHYNPSTNTITYYYRDSDTGRWIISVEPFVPRSPNIGQLSHIVFSNRSSGDGFVFRWIPFMSRKLI